MRITAIIPTYNRYELLKRAISSLMAQSYLVDEIIVVDDGSTDNTFLILQDFPNIKYIHQKNSGVSSARNAAIALASNAWIAFLDSDDEWHHQKLQKQVDFHTKNPNILLSYTAERWIRNGIEVKIPKKFRKIGKDIFLENISYCNIAPSSVVLHKKILDRVGCFDEGLEVCEDYDLWLRILCHYNMGLLNEQLICKYAGHDEQLGFRKDMDKYRIQVLEKLLLACDSKEKKTLITNELKAKKARQK